MHKICNKCGHKLLLDINWTYPLMKQRKYICNDCHKTYAHKAREARQLAKEENRLELFELDMKVEDLCEKIYRYRRVKKFLYSSVKAYFGLNTVKECKTAIWLLEYNLMICINLRHRRKNKYLAIQNMKSDPEFSKAVIDAKY